MNFFQNKKFATKYSLKKKVLSFGEFFPKKITAHDAPKNMRPRDSLRARLFEPPTPPHNLCPKAWACIIYKWARGKLFCSTGIIVKSFI